MKKIILFFAVIILLILVIILPTVLIRARLVCESQYGECSESVKSELYSIEGKPIGLARRTIDKQLRSNFLVSNYTVQYKLPNVLKVSLLVKKPVFSIKDGSGNYAYVESEGIVLSVSKENSLPFVIIQGDLPAVGKYVGDEYLLALQLIDGTNKMYSVTFGTIESGNFLVDLPSGIRVIFPLTGYDRETLLGSLRLIYSEIQNGENGHFYKEIDLRYANPVLR